MYYIISSLKTQTYLQSKETLIQGAHKAILELAKDLPKNGGFLIVARPHGEDSRLTARIFDLDADGAYIGGIHFFIAGSPYVATFEPKKFLEPGDVGFSSKRDWNRTTWEEQCARSDMWHSSDIYLN